MSYNCFTLDNLDTAGGQVLGQAHKALMAAGVALPPTLREKARI